MKYLLILFTVFTFGQASSQMVAFTQASTLGFTLNAGQSHVTSNQCMTKSEALAKYNISAGNMSGFANNQLVPRSAWVNSVIGIPFTTNLNSFNNSFEICEFTQQYPITNYTISGLIVGARIYQDSACTIEITGSTVLRGAVQYETEYSWRRGVDNSVSEVFECVILQ